MSTFAGRFLLSVALLLAAVWPCAAQDKQKEEKPKPAAGDLKVQEAELAKLQQAIAAKEKELAGLLRQALDLQNKIAAQKAPKGPKADFANLQAVFQGIPVEKRPRDSEDTLGAERAIAWL